VTGDWPAYIEVGGIIFAAGIFYAGVRLMRKDLTGVRRIVDANDKRQNRKTTKLLKLLRKALPEEYDDEIVDMLPQDEE
jgi:hypothetical protein